MKQALHAMRRAANIYDYDFIVQVARIVGSDKSRLIAVICAHANRSTRAVQMLAAAGFSNVQPVREGAGYRVRAGLAGKQPTDSELRTLLDMHY